MTSSPHDTTGRKCDQIAGNNHIDNFICLCFKYISQEDQLKFLKKFRRNNPDQKMHTFNELILGAYLASKGFRVRHDHVIDKKTPDWCIFDNKSAVIGIIELTNFHLDQTTENEIKREMETNDIAVFWRDGNKDNVCRLYHSIWEKADVYHGLIEKLKTPYVVSVFGGFETDIELEEVQYCLFDKEIGLFEEYSDLSGILYFREECGRYSFEYVRNPHALEVLDIPSDTFPTELLQSA